MFDDFISRLAGWFGSDVDAMRRAAHELEEQAERIHRCGESMWAELNQVWWQGPDADRFRANWDQIHRRASRQIAIELRDLSARLRQEAMKQDRASKT